jgi:hypothetical protein
MVMTAILPLYSQEIGDDMILKQLMGISGKNRKLKLKCDAESFLSLRTTFVHDYLPITCGEPRFEGVTNGGLGTEASV